MIDVVLPAPPSANHLFWYRHGKRIKTNRYRRWLDVAEAAFRLAAGRPEPEKRARSWIVIEAAIGHNRDLDNLLKPTLDAVVRSRAIDDDKWTNSIRMQRVSPTDELPKGHMRVEVGLIQ